MPSKTVLFVLLLFTTLASSAQPVDAIFSKYIQFLGGEQRLHSLKSRIDSGTYNYGGLEFPYSAYAKAPNLYRYIVTYNGKYFAQAFDGKEGWKIDAFKNQKQKNLLYGEDAKAMANEADVNLEPAFIDYKKKGYTATLEGTDTVDGKTCYRIKLQQPDKTSAEYLFDQQTGALLEKIAIAKNVELNGATLETFYSDYTDVDGLKFPFKSVSKIKDQTILTILVKGVVLNPSIADGSFAP
ncbi:MAG TPA: hypothetical protein VGM89_12150 [Puia sp.]|jgi:hypothetical protein